MTNEEMRAAVEEFNSTARPDITNAEPDYAKENDILQFADEIVTYVLNELEGGMWREQFAALSIAEKKFLYAAIDDGFNDSVDN
jgi:hypothetical protein